MPKPPHLEQVRADQRRVTENTKNVYQPWEDDYQCDLLEQYFYGKQWQGDDDKKKYLINLVYTAIKLSKPSLLFQIPAFKVTPRITRIDDPLSDADARAKLQENTLNTFVQDKKIGLKDETSLALFDAYP